MNALMNNINRMFPSQKGQQNFMNLSILTFGLTLDTIADLTDMSKEDFYKKYIYYSSLCEAVNRRWQHIANTQEEAAFNFKDFVRRLMIAYIARDSEAFTKITHEITDHDALGIIRGRKKGGSLTNENILVILKYQIKYGLSNTDISQICSMDRSRYGKKVEALIEEYPEYRHAYETLVDAHVKTGQYYYDDTVKR